jgi:hypothetical protein
MGFSSLNREIRSKVVVYPSVATASTAGNVFTTTTPINSVAVLDDTDVISFSIEEDIAPNGSLTIGTATSSYLEMTLSYNTKTKDINFNGRVFSIAIGTKETNGTTYYSAMGLFLIEEVRIDKKKQQITLSGFDYMILSEKLVDITKFNQASIKKYDLWWFADAAAAMMGLSLDSEIYYGAGIHEMTNGSVHCPYESNIEKLSKLSVRQLIAYIAELSGTNAYITKDGKLTFRWMVTDPITILSDNIFNVKPAESGELQRITGVTLDGVDNTFETRGSGAWFINIKNNPLCSGAASFIDAIYNKLSIVSYRPYSMKWMGNPTAYEKGTYIRVNTGLSAFDYITAPITTQKITYAGGLKCESEAKGRSQVAMETSKSNMDEYIDTTTFNNSLIEMPQELPSGNVGKIILDKNGFVLNVNGVVMPYVACIGKIEATYLNQVPSTIGFAGERRRGIGMYINLGSSVRDVAGAKINNNVVNLPPRVWIIPTLLALDTTDNNGSTYYNYTYDTDCHWDGRMYWYDSSDAITPYKAYVAGSGQDIYAWVTVSTRFDGSVASYENYKFRTKIQLLTFCG